MFVPDDQTVPPNLPRLISFPRTGSHWLRMALELYFDRPLLTRHFFEHDDDRPLLVHDHDVALEATASGPVIYLYRNPVDVVFSELTYHRAARAVELTPAEVDAVSDAYRRHLRRWLLGDGREGPEPVTIAYEWMLDRPIEALRSVVEALGGAFDAARLAGVWSRVTPSLVRERTEHDPSVIDRAADKQLRRDLFRYRHGPRIIAAFERDGDLRAAIDPAMLGAVAEAAAT